MRSDCAAANAIGRIDGRQFESSGGVNHRCAIEKKRLTMRAPREAASALT
jgi:hypothetical protein